MEYKGLAGSIKDVDSGGRVVTGFFASFGNKDLDGDIIQEGSFSKTISERGPKGVGLIAHLQDHDHLKAVGKIQLLEETPFGLYFESKIGNHDAGRNYLSLCADFIINQHSIGYSVVKEQKLDANTNLITELKLYEGSGIQFLAANPNTPVTGIKSFEEMFELARKLDKALHNGNYTDEMFILMQDRLKSLSEKLSEILLKNSTSEDINNQPSTDTKPLENTLPDDVTIAQVKEEVKKIDYAKLLKTALS